MRKRRSYYQQQTNIKKHKMRSNKSFNLKTLKNETLASVIPKSTETTLSWKDKPKWVYKAIDLSKLSNTNSMNFPDGGLATRRLYQQLRESIPLPAEAPRSSLNTIQYQKWKELVAISTKIGKDVFNHQAGFEKKSGRNRGRRGLIMSTRRRGSRQSGYSDHRNRQRMSYNQGYNPMGIDSKKSTNRDSPMQITTLSPERLQLTEKDLKEIQKTLTSHPVDSKSQKSTYFGETANMTKFSRTRARTTYSFRYKDIDATTAGSSSYIKINLKKRDGNLDILRERKKFVNRMRLSSNMFYKAHAVGGEDDFDIKKEYHKICEIEAKNKKQGVHQAENPDEEYESFMTEYPKRQNHNLISHYKIFSKKFGKRKLYQKNRRQSQERIEELFLDSQRRGEAQAMQQMENRVGKLKEDIGRRMFNVGAQEGIDDDICYSGAFSNDGEEDAGAQNVGNGDSKLRSFFGIFDKEKSLNCLKGERRDQMDIGLIDIDDELEKINKEFEQQGWRRDPSFYLNIPYSILIQFLREIVIKYYLKNSIYKVDLPINLKKLFYNIILRDDRNLIEQIRVSKNTKKQDPSQRKNQKNYQKIRQKGNEDNIEDLLMAPHKSDKTIKLSPSVIRRKDGRHHVAEVIMKETKKSKKECVELLKKCFEDDSTKVILIKKIEPIFKQILHCQQYSRSLRMLFLTTAKLHEFQRDEIIYEQGEPNTSLFFIYKGLVCLETQKMEGIGKFDILDRVYEGRAFGQFKLLGNVIDDPTAASLITKLCTIHFKSDVLKDYPNENAYRKLRSRKKVHAWGHRARAETHTILISIPNLFYQKVMMSLIQTHFGDMLVAVKKVKMFYNIPLFAQILLLSVMSSYVYKMGHVLVQQGDPKTKAFFVVKGSCDLIFEHHNRAPRRQRFLGNHPFKIKELKHGGYLGIDCFKQGINQTPQEPREANVSVIGSNSKLPDKSVLGGKDGESEVKEGHTNDYLLPPGQSEQDQSQSRSYQLSKSFLYSSRRSESQGQNSSMNSTARRQKKNQSVQPNPDSQSRYLGDEMDENGRFLYRLSAVVRTSSVLVLELSPEKLEMVPPSLKKVFMDNVMKYTDFDHVVNFRSLRNSAITWNKFKRTKIRDLVKKNAVNLVNRGAAGPNSKRLKNRSLSKSSSLKRNYYKKTQEKKEARNKGETRKKKRRINLHTKTKK